MIRRFVAATVMLLLFFCDGGIGWYDVSLPEHNRTGFVCADPEYEQTVKFPKPPIIPLR